MNYRLKSAFAVLLCVALLLFALATATAATVTKVTLNYRSATIYVEGETGGNTNYVPDEVLDLRASIGNSNCNWFTLNADVADVQNGRVTAVGVGQTTIFAVAKENGAVYAACPITVAVRPKITSISFLDATGKRLTAYTPTQQEVRDYACSLRLDIQGLDEGDAFSDYFTVTSSKPNVAMVADDAYSEGQLSIDLLSPGTTTIGVTSKHNAKMTARINITVRDYSANPVKRIEIKDAYGNRPNLNIKTTKGETTVNISAVVYGNKNIPLAEVPLNWTSSDESLVTIEPMGPMAQATERALVISKFATGNVTITASTISGARVSASITLNLTVADEYAANGVNIYGAAGLYPVPNRVITLDVGNETYTDDEWLDYVEYSGIHEYMIQAVPVNANGVEIANSSDGVTALRWTSSAPQVLKVIPHPSMNTLAFLKPLRPGRATITVATTDGTNHRATATVVVNERMVQSIAFDEGATGMFADQNGAITVQKGTITMLQTLFVPQTAYNTTLAYKSGNTRVVTVGADGAMTAVGEGSATVTVTSRRNGKLQYTLPVTVTGGNAPATFGVAKMDAMNANPHTPYVGDVLNARYMQNNAMMFASNYQWYRVDNSGQKTAIQGATTNNYTVTANDVGYKLTLEAVDSNTNAPLSWTSQASVKKYVVKSLVTYVNDKQVNGEIGALEVGDYIFVRPIITDGQQETLMSYEDSRLQFQWKYGDGTPAYAYHEGYNAQFYYQITEESLGKVLCLELTSQELDVSGITWRTAGEVCTGTLLGATLQGAQYYPGELTVAIRDNATALGMPPNAVVTYLWYRDNVALPNQTSASYTLTQADDGAVISVDVIPGEHTKGNTVTLKSGRIRQNAVYSVTIVDAQGRTVNEPVLGETLYAKVSGTATQDQFDYHCTYRWGYMSNGVLIPYLASESSNKLTLANEAILGQTIAVEVTTTDFMLPLGRQNVMYTCKKPVIRGKINASVRFTLDESGYQVLSGSPIVGMTIYAHVQDIDQPQEQRKVTARAAVATQTTYKWYVGRTELTGNQNQTSLIITEAHVGQTIRVVVEKQHYYGSAQATTYAVVQAEQP